MLIAKTFSFWQQNFAILLSSTHSLTFMHNSVASKFIIVQAREKVYVRKIFRGLEKGKINTLKVIIILYFLTTFHKNFLYKINVYFMSLENRMKWKRSTKCNFINALWKALWTLSMLNKIVCECWVCEWVSGSKRKEKFYAITKFSQSH
jgi:hypothetical protein